jgi:signal transduction histidine kinase
LSLTKLVSKYRQSKKAEKQQISILIWGLSLSILLGLLSSVITPIIFTALNLLDTDIYFTIQNIAPLATVVFAAAVTFAILKYQFLDIKLVIGRLVYYLTLGVFPYTVFFIMVGTYENIFGTVFVYEVYVVSILVSVAFVWTFNWLNNFIKRQVDIRIINPVYDALTEGELLNKEMATAVSMVKISNIAINSIKRTIRSAFTEIILLNESEEIDEIYSSRDAVKLQNPPFNQLITLWESSAIAPLVYDQLMNDLPQAFKNLPNFIPPLISFMEINDIKVILPIGNERIRGMIILGQKEANVSYSLQDIDFLVTMSATTSAAIERSLLYEEVQDFNKTLQKKVDAATSELKKASTDLERTLEQVQELRRQERDMIDVMGHELRTPISIVRNAVIMMQNHIQTSPNSLNTEMLLKYAEMGVESARREVRLIETLLSATKVEGNRIQLDFVKVDLKDVINDSIEGNKSMAIDKNLTIAYNPPAGNVLVYCDRVRIQEVMDNFLSNAIKYTPRGEVGIEIEVDQAKSMAYVHVKDTGIGIDPEDLKQLGRKFFRAKQYIKKDTGDEKIVRPGGTGLGLYVTFELISLMNGERRIDSEVGKGSVFTFGMPLHTGQADKHIDQTFLADGTLVETPEARRAVERTTPAADSSQ